MSRWINWVTFFRNLISSLILGFLVPYYLIINLDPNGILFNVDALIINGWIFLLMYSFYGFFKKETVIRFFIGCGWIATLVYFYTVGSNVYTSYLPNCGFGLFCVDGELNNVKIAFQFSYAWLIIIFLSLKGLNLFRHLVKPMEEKKYDYLQFSKYLGE